jgi:hypothetical protein
MKLGADSLVQEVANREAAEACDQETQKEMPQRHCPESEVKWTACYSFLPFLCSLHKSGTPGPGYYAAGTV